MDGNLANDHRRRRTAQPLGPDAVHWREIQNAVATIHFGEVRILIQDGYVVQIDRLEKQRLR
jgi:hypothetical protein